MSWIGRIWWEFGKKERRSGLDRRVLKWVAPAGPMRRILVRRAFDRKNTGWGADGGWPPMPKPLPGPPPVPIRRDPGA